MSTNRISPLPTHRQPTAKEHFRDASKVLVAGLSGSARENPGLPHPFLAQRGDGPWLIDSEEMRYLDFHTGFGATILGHNHPRVRAAIEQALDLGIVHGSETVYAERLAAKIVELVPSAELVRYANSGSEATMAAIRLARAHTGRKKLLKFEGHFHGLHDHVIFSTHPPPRDVQEKGKLLEPTIDSGGVPAEFAEMVLVAPWGDIGAVELALRQHSNEIAAIIMEPINYNSGCLKADPTYMASVRELASDSGTVLIYDEILSGFRTGTNCAQGYYGVTPDITLLGKAIANAVPLAIITGNTAIMEEFSPLGSAAHSGTYSGHIFGLLAGLATLEELASPGFYDGPEGIFSVGDHLYKGLREIFQRHSVKCRVQGFGARFGLYFGLDPITEPRVYQDVALHDSNTLRKFIGACFSYGVYFHSYDVSLGHHGFGAAHGLSEIDEALGRIDHACSTM